jgi:transposase
MWMCSLSEILLPDGATLHLEKITLIREEKTLTLTIHSTQEVALCPDCETGTNRIHSHYWRSLTDLPCAGLLVQWRLRVRQFFCNVAHCPRKIFNKRLPAVVKPWARRTQQLAESQQAIGFALGGIAAHRLSQQLRMPASLDTFLRLIRQAATLMDRPGASRVVGIDDWALRKGMRYGAILVDLEAGRIIDLLPDCQHETVTTWLRSRPTIEVVSRDRATAYAGAISVGASQAIQVADRWH